MTALAGESSRLFFGEGALAAPDGSLCDFALLRILEEGDSADLRALGRSLGIEGRARLADLVRTHGARKLSARSRRFWAMALALAETERRPIAEALWPLA